MVTGGRTTRRPRSRPGELAAAALAWAVRYVERLVRLRFTWQRRSEIVRLERSGHLDRLLGGHDHATA